MKVTVMGDVAVVNSDEVIIHNGQSTLDFIATIGYDTGLCKIVINKSAISESFFDLKTTVIGDIIQKLVNYNVKLAIVGDYSEYKSDSLKALIRESNRGKDLFFLLSEENAIEKLAAL